LTGLRSGDPAQLPATKRRTKESFAITEERRGVGIADDEDVPPIEAEWAIVELTPIHSLAVGEKTREWTLRFGIVIDATGVAVCFRPGVTSLRCNITFSFGRGCLERVRIPSNALDLRQRVARSEPQLVFVSRK
jgi:hypothetical protein